MMDLGLTLGDHCSKAIPLSGSPELHLVWLGGAQTPRKRLPDWASLELSPSVESCGCGLGPSPVRLG